MTLTEYEEAEKLRLEMAGLEIELAEMEKALAAIVVRCDHNINGISSAVNDLQYTGGMVKSFGVTCKICGTKWNLA